MTAFLGIFKKDLIISFTTPVAYVVFFFFNLITSVSFSNYLDEYGKAVQKARHFEDAELLSALNFTDAILIPVTGWVLVLFLLVVPVLTMRVFAEEKRQRTMELLLTSPISPWQIVLGKFAAVAVIIALMAALTLVYPVILSIYGTTSLIGASVVDWATCLLSVFGVFLAGLMFVSIGLFTSSLTESQVVAAVTALLVLLGLWVGPPYAADVPGFIGAFAGFVGPSMHVGNFVKGLFDLTDLLYFISLTAFFLFFTHRSVEGERWA